MEVMDAYISDNGKIISYMVKANLVGQMEKNSLANIKKT